MSESNITKGNKIIRLEERLTSLQKANKRLKTNLKRNQTVLSKEQNAVQDVQRKLANIVLDKSEKMAALSKEVELLFQEFQKSKKISRAEKREMKALHKEMKEQGAFEGLGMPDEEEVRKQFEQMHEEREKSEKKFHSDMFQQFRIQPNEKDQKELRKVFIKLAAEFHPDKAKNEKEAEAFHSIMQQINQAYQKGDIAKLLEMQTQYSGKELVEVSDLDNTALMSLVEEKVANVTQENTMLNSQLTRLKKELRIFRQSELGHMYKDYKYASKWSEDPIEEMTGDLSEGIQTMESMKNALEYYIEHGEEPPSDMFPYPGQQSMSLDALFDDMFDNEPKGKKREQEPSMGDLEDFLGFMAEQMEKEFSEKKKKRRK